jgi:hypothetical protein
MAHACRLIARPSAATDIATHLLSLAENTAPASPARLSS